MNMAGELLCMSFNQNASCIIVGTKNGYRIFNCHPFGRNVFSTDGGIGVAKMLFCTSLVCLVGGGENPAFSPRRLKLWNTKTQSAICELNFPSNILSVELNHKRLVVILEDKLHIYDLETMALAANLQTLEMSKKSLGRKGRSKLNPSSLCALSPDHEKNCYLALPAENDVGDIIIYDALNLVNFSIINAHKSLITAMSFSLNGKMLATASETGTVIRVFSIPSGEKLYIFRRGTYAATVYSLGFNEIGSMLSVSSDTGTIHVFNLSCNPDERKHTTNMEDSSNSLNRSRMTQRTVTETAKANIMSAATGAFNKMDSLFEKRKLVTGMLPESLSDYVEPSRSFAYAKIGGSKPVITICTLADNYLRVVSNEGKFYQYVVQRGECQLVLEMPLYGSTLPSSTQTQGYTQMLKFQEEISEQE